jgi:hypothetical protein
MKRLSILCLACVLAATSWSAAAWDYYAFDLPSEAPESQWRDALARHIHGQSEVSIEGGRVDVLTDELAIEVDWNHKWHEGLGQALHYGDATGRQGVLALIAYGTGPEKLTEKTRRRLDLAEDQCTKNGVRMVVLFPTRSRSRADRPDSGPVAESRWINTSTGVRHNGNCTYYGHTKRGRLGTSGEGKPCGICGG